MGAVSGEAIVATLVGVAAGGLITWLCSWWYYKRAGDQLRDEAADLRGLSLILIGALENRGVEVRRDERGYPIGYPVGTEMSVAWRTEAPSSAAPAAEDQSRSE